MNTFDAIDRPRLLAAARRLLGSTADAEDAVQDALVRALAQPRLDTPQAWLTTVVRHLAIDRLRQRALEHGAPADEPHSPSAEDLAADAQEATRALRVLADSLLPSDAAMLLLREVFEFDYREIARRAGKSEAACRQIVHRALARLRAPHHHLPPDDRETADAVFVLCQRALRTGSPAPLHALIGMPAITSRTAKASRPASGATQAARSSRLMRVEGRYVLVLMHEGELLCCMPIGFTPTGELVATHA